MVFLVVDEHPVHVAARTERWVAQHRRRIRLFFLPGYSPELNPDELLNQDVKTNAVGRKRPRTQPELIDNVRRFLWSTQRRPKKVRSYFRHRSVCYAA
jgi:transposase